MRYEIDSNNVIQIWVTDAKAPNVIQGQYPNGEAWTAEEAEEWAVQWIASASNESNLLPKQGPGLEQEEKSRGAAPFESWTFDEATWGWEPPTPMPEDGSYYFWDEDTLAWVSPEAAE